MKTIKSLILVLFACIAFSACTTKESTLNDLRDLKESVTANSANYTVDDWKMFLSEFEKTDSLLNTYELTDEEKEEVRKIKNQCARYILKGSAKVAGSELKETLDGAVNEAKDALNGLIEGITGGNNENK